MSILHEFYSLGGGGLYVANVILYFALLAAAFIPLRFSVGQKYRGGL
jgi:hypothetical protein